MIEEHWVLVIADYCCHEKLNVKLNDTTDDATKTNVSKIKMYLK